MTAAAATATATAATPTAKSTAIGRGAGPKGGISGTNPRAQCVVHVSMDWPNADLNALSSGASGAVERHVDFSRPARTRATRRRFPTLLLAAQLLERRLLSRVAGAGDGTRPIRAILAFHRTARQRIQISVRPIHRNVDDALGAWVCARNAALRAGAASDRRALRRWRRNSRCSGCRGGRHAASGELGSRDLQAGVGIVDRLLNSIGPLVDRRA